ncbi:MAG: MEDS domain-containing protein [Caldilineaceae bacterium]
MHRNGVLIFRERITMATSKPNGEQPLLRVEEVAQLLRTTPRTVYRWLNDGKILGKKVGRSWRIPKQVVADLAGEGIETEVGSVRKASALFGQGEHLLALAPEREAVAGMMVRLVEMGLQHRYRIFAGCWSFAPDELRKLMRSLGIPTDALEAEGMLTIADFSTAFDAEGAEGVLQEWRKLVDASQQDGPPLLAIGAPSLDCWDEHSGRLVEFEAALNELWHEADAVSVCVYPLSDFVPARLWRVGTLISHHTGVLLWSETELMLLRPEEFSQMFITPDWARN